MKRLLISLGILCALTVATLCWGGAAVEPPAACVHCGMDRTTFKHSRMLIAYEDGHTAGTCSINCIAVDLDKNAGKKVKSVKVSDYKSNALIDAKSAVWVMGGSKKGVMTKLPKWAFSSKADAQGFIKESGGEIATYEVALAEAAKNKMPGKKKMGADSGESHEKKH